MQLVFVANFMNHYRLPFRLKTNDLTEGNYLFVTMSPLPSEIKRICTERPYSQDACLTRSKHFDMNERFQEYIELYKEI